MRNVYTYEKRGAGLPVPVGAEARLGARTLWTAVIDEFRAVPPFDEAEFRLSAFGLPEPVGVPGVERAGVRWYIWLALASAACACVAAALVMVRRRRQRNAVGAAPAQPKEIAP